jgi:hypothetical protein
LVGISLNVINSGPRRIGSNRDTLVDGVVGSLDVAEGCVRGFIEIGGQNKRGDSQSDQKQTEYEKEID